MKYYYLFLLVISLIGCSSSHISLRNSNYEKRKILFYVDYLNERKPEAKILIDDFIKELKYKMNGSLIEPIDFINLKMNHYVTYSKAYFFNNGYLNTNSNLDEDDKLITDKPDDKVLITFDFEYTSQWSIPRKISNVCLYVINSTTREMDTISIAESPYSNLSNKVIDGIWDANIFSTPKIDTIKIIREKLSKISTMIDGLTSNNEYGSRGYFDESITSTNIIKNSLDNIEPYTHNTEFTSEFGNLKNKLFNKIYNIYVSYSENQIDKKAAESNYRELIDKYQSDMTKDQQNLINTKLRDSYSTYPSISIEVKGWSRLNNTDLHQFSSLLSERVQNIWRRKDTIKYLFQYQDTRPVNLIIEYHSARFPFSITDIDGNNYAIYDKLGWKLLLNLSDNFSLYNNYVPELSYDLDKFLENVTIDYYDSKDRCVELFCFAYVNSTNGLNIKVSEIRYKQKDWHSYKLIKFYNKISSVISFTTFEKEFKKYLLDE
jgi:hypothetical protein